MSEGARGRFQIHLFTAVVLMITAGVLMWANVLPAKSGIGRVELDTPMDERYSRAEYTIKSTIMHDYTVQLVDALSVEYREALAVQHREARLLEGPLREVVVKPQRGFGKFELVYYGWPYSVVTHASGTVVLWNEEKPIDELNSFYEYKNAGINGIVALAILFALWFVCEWWIRRRAARKGT